MNLHHTTYLPSASDKRDTLNVAMFTDIKILWIFLVFKNYNESFLYIYLKLAGAYHAYLNT